MKEISTCSICSDVKEFNFDLLNMSLDRKKIGVSNKLTIGVERNILSSEKNEKNIYEVDMSINLLCFNAEGKLQPKAPSEVTDEQINFKIDLIYKIGIKFIDDCKVDFDNNTTKAAINDYAWSIIYPTLSENITYLGSKVGIPQLKIPYSIDKK